MSAPELLPQPPLDHGCLDCGAGAGADCADTCPSFIAAVQDYADLEWQQCCPSPRAAAARLCGCGGHPYL